MSKLIGHSLLKLSDNSEIIWTGAGLPWKVRWSGGQTTFDKVGQIAPDASKPLVKMVERWQTDDPGVNQRQIGYGTPTYNAIDEHMEVAGAYEDIPQSELDETARVGGIEAELGVVAMLDKLNTATTAGIDSYVDSNVTDLASARTMLKQIVKLLAYFNRRVS